jgi:hypothetical protein
MFITKEREFETLRTVISSYLSVSKNVPCDWYPSFCTETCVIELSRNATRDGETKTGSQVSADRGRKNQRSAVYQTQQLKRQRKQDREVQMIVNALKALLRKVNSMIRWMLNG